ncbi:MAG: hypothetical protein ACRDMJ_14465 [Solirubrobacteraceae bacterium]
MLIGYARAMPKGTWFGRPLAGDVDTGLGCSEWGVHLNVKRAADGPQPIAPGSG